MKRILYDVPRWHIYLHRDARGLPPVERDETAARRFEDELFDRLYAGESEQLPEARRDKALGAWAEKVHATCDQLPSFARLAEQCRGDAASAATAVESLMAELQPLMRGSGTAPDPHPLRQVVRAGCERAVTAVETMQEAGEGLEQVAFGWQPGTSSVGGEVLPNARVRTLAMQLKDDARLKRIALLAGRFKRIAALKLRQKVKHGTDEISDVEQGADLARILPSEMARLLHPRLRLAVLRDLAERRCLQYALTGSASLGKGPIVACLDKSGSMSGEPDIWATAVALALLDVAQRQRRPFALLSFDSGIKYEAVVTLGELLPEPALFVSCEGGTDISNVIARGLDLIEQHPGALRKADLVLITDGSSNTSEAPSLKERASLLGVMTLGCGIGVEPASLMPWCDEVQAITDLTNLDDKTAARLFAS